MTTPMSCDEFAERLSDFLERDSRAIDDSTRAAMELHARSCGECGALVADLRELRVAAGNLPALAPSRDLWAGVAARIETPVVELGRGRGGDATAGAGSVGGRPGRRLDRRVWLGLAAAALVGITATVTREVTRSHGTSPGAAPPARSAGPSRLAMDPVDSNVDRATGASASDSSVRGAAAPRATVSLASNAPAKLSPEATYDHEIADLRVIVNRRQSELDSSTVAVITHNLRIIDDAIAQCRTALKKDPASRFLMESLDDALDTKVQMLRTVAMLPSRS